MIELGKIIGSEAKPGDVFGLIGDLGAGKTHFTKGLVLGNDCDKTVTSPTSVSYTHLTLPTILLV